MALTPIDLAIAELTTNLISAAAAKVQSNKGTPKKSSLNKFKKKAFLQQKRRKEHYNNRIEEEELRLKKLKEQKEYFEKNI